MKSPFQMFRTHQKVLMVVLVGLSMIGFVLLGAVPDPSNMPKALVFISVVAVVAGAAWIAGMPSKRSAEYGAWGVVLGAALAFLLTMTGGPPAAVTAESGNLSAQELMDLRNRRQAANSFVGQVISETRDPQELNFLAQQYQFGFGFDGSVMSDRDIVTTELLRREADRLGLSVTIDSVYDYIKQISDNKLSSGKFKEIRTSLGLSETELHSILQSELQARLAAEYLYDYEFDDLFRYSPTLTPQEYWEFYQRMYVAQKAEVAAIPVEPFIDETAEPSPNELATFFEEHRRNFPNLTEKNAVEEGRPGFRQPRRVQLAYLEAVFDDFRDGIEPVTEEDIRERYESDYVQPAEAAAARAAEAEAIRGNESGPALPDQPATPDEGEPAAPTEDAPAGDAAEGDTPAPADSTDPATPDATPSDSPTPETPQPSSDSPTESDPPAEAEGAPQSRLLPPDSQLQQVALFQEPTDAEPAAESPASEGTAAESATEPSSEPAEQPAESTTDPAAPAATDTPAESTPEPSGDTPAETEPSESSTEPVTTEPATETPAEGTAPTGDQPAAPSSTVPLLDEQLKAQIRISIEKDRVAERLREATAAAANFVEDVALAMRAPEGDPTRLSAADAAKKLEAYAAENKLHYAVTPLLSGLELSESEEHPVGQAVTVSDATNPQPIPNAVFQTGAQDTYRPIIARSPVTDSWFVTWKIDDREPYIPEDMSDERIRDQVVSTWREVQAREKAKARAAELAQLVEQSGKPMAEVLGDKTVTGAEGELNITLAETGDFRWLSIPGSPQPNPFSFYPPEIQDPPGVEKAGADFMEAVFAEIGQGETGVAANYDRSTYYVVHVTERTPAQDAESFEDFRKRFLYEPVFEQNDFLAQFGLDPRSVYQRLAVRTMIEYQSDWVDDLWKRHDATLFEAAEG